MPQTGEHHDIPHLLGVKSDIVVITKKDLVEGSATHGGPRENRDSHEDSDLPEARHTLFRHAAPGRTARAWAGTLVPVPELHLRSTLRSRRATADGRADRPLPARDGFARAAQLNHPQSKTQARATRRPKGARPGIWIQGEAKMKPTLIKSVAGIAAVARGPFDDRFHSSLPNVSTSEAAR